ASAEFDIAKQLDPKDPTPWFYDAIHKQTTNRPVEALHDLQKAIDLNDNRAVYRSSLLLDQDEAARSASLGRIYNDLGFQQLGLLEGWKSVNTDPNNYSAHRLLADNYAALPRHEIARVSELLQSQLLQPLNITPVQPNLGESNSLILEGSGPSNPSFNEFNPLFTRNRLVLQASGVAGDNDTLGDEVTQSGIWDKFSYSLGQFHFETDGFRENNDLNQDIYNVFLQGAITPQFNLQAEYRRREAKQGDLLLNFDPDNFSRDSRRNIDQDVARIGGHLSLWPSSDFIISAVYTDRSELLSNSTFINPRDDEGYQVEAQHLFRYNWLNAILGGGTYRIDTNGQVVFLSDGFTVPLESTNTHDNAYLYFNLNLRNMMTWTLGLGYDSFHNIDKDLERLSPKVGLQLNPTDWMRLRLAYFQTVKRLQAVDQTIEPTHLAGFNQFFDNENGTLAERYGAGIDVRATDNVYAGVEYTRRELEVPALSGQGRVTFDRSEESATGYLYWALNPRWTAAIEAAYEQFKRSSSDLSVERGGAPTKVETVVFPVSMRYFHPAGFFAGVSGTFVWQDLDLAPTSTFEPTHDEFFVVDASVGYRLPKRWGIMSVEIKNIVDEQFLFQDLNVQTARAEEYSRFIPDRTIFVRATFAFD
ncbi:MAG: TonB-dependent receptor, partial [Gammaproteobacteria bacterium]|nr:TonB-dependent receptor [Gammaproteobacteria bacterium]